MAVKDAIETSFSGRVESYGRPCHIDKSSLELVSVASHKLDSRHASIITITACFIIE